MIVMPSSILHTNAILHTNKWLWTKQQRPAIIYPVEISYSLPATAVDLPAIAVEKHG